MFQISAYFCHSPSNQTEIPKTHNTNCEIKNKKNIGQEIIARASPTIRVKSRPNPERNKPEKFLGIKELERGKQPRKWKELLKGSRKNEKDLNLSNGKNITKEEKQNPFKKILTIIF